MELHERLVTTKPAVAAAPQQGAVRRPQELDPHARHQRARPAADGPGDRPRRHARPRHRGHPPAPLRRDGHLPRRPRAAHERDRRRHPRLRAARAAPRRRLDHGDHGQRPGRDLDRASGPPLRDDRALQRRLAPAPHHQPHGGADRAPHRRVLADGRRTPPRRLARQRDHRAALALRAAPHDPQVLAQAPRAPGHGQHRLAQRGVGRLPAALHHGAAQRPHLGRYGLGQDDAAERAFLGHPGQRADRDDRGRRRAPAPPAARAPARGAPAEHRGRGRDPDPRPRPELAAHAPRPDHRRRVPWPGGARHAPGDEHGPRRVALDRPRQRAARRALPPRDDGADGRLRPARAGDPAAGLLRARPDRPHRAHGGRLAPLHRGHRGAAHGVGRDHACRTSSSSRSTRSRPTGRSTGSSSRPGCGRSSSTSSRSAGIELPAGLFSHRPVATNVADLRR